MIRQEIHGVQKITQHKKCLTSSCGLFRTLELSIETETGTVLITCFSDELIDIQTE